MAEKRSFTFLKKNKSPEDFDSFCREVTKRYANSTSEFSRSYYMNTYMISEKCFYSIIEYAITRNLVDDEIFMKAREKAAKNAAAHAEGACKSTYAKYSKMYIVRQAYAISKAKAIEIAETYVRNPQLSLVQIADSYNMKPVVLQNLLERIIVDNICSDILFEAIETRSLRKCENSRIKETKQYFAGLKRRRTMNSK